MKSDNEKSENEKTEQGKLENVYSERNRMKSQKLLHLLGELDDEFVDTAKESTKTKVRFKIKDRIKKQEPSKMKTLRLRRYAIAAGICLLVAAGLYALPKLFPRNMDASLSEGEAASSVSLLMYNGVLYIGIGNPENTPIPLGKALGTVEIKWRQHRWFDDFYAIRSNSLEVGDTIYEWEGYSSEFRICAVTADGTVHKFECMYTGDPFGITFPERLEHAVHTLGGSIPDWIRYKDETADVSIPEWFPDASDIVGISIYDKQDYFLKNIDSPEDIQKIVDSFAEGCRYKEITGNEINYRDGMLYLYLKLKDGSNIRIVLYDSTYGNWKGYITLPEGLFDLVNSYIGF